MLRKCMAQRRRATSSGQEAGVNVHLKDKGRSLQDSKGEVLAGEDRNLKRGVEEGIIIGGGKLPVVTSGKHRLQPDFSWDHQCIYNNKVWAIDS